MLQNKSYQQQPTKTNATKQELPTTPTKTNATKQELPTNTKHQQKLMLQNKSYQQRYQ